MENGRFFDLRRWVGAFAFGGEGNQAKLLEEDGVVVVDGKVDLDVYGM